MTVDKEYDWVFHVFLGLYFFSIHSGEHEEVVIFSGASSSILGVPAKHLIKIHMYFLRVFYIFTFLQIYQTQINYINLTGFWGFGVLGFWEFFQGQ